MKIGPRYGGGGPSFYPWRGFHTLRAQVSPDDQGQIGMGKNTQIGGDAEFWEKHLS